MASISITLSPEQADSFLRRLAEDEAYRQRMRDAPKEALAEYGIELSDDAALLIREIPPEEALKRLLASEPLCPPTSFRKAMHDRRTRRRRGRHGSAGDGETASDLVGPPGAGDCISLGTALLAAAIRRPPVAPPTDPRNR